MFRGEKVVLRSMRRDDLPRQCEFNNDAEFELLGGGDLPEPQSLERLEAQFDENVRQGDRNGPSFAIEADGRYIGNCALFHLDLSAGTAELGIGIGDREFWGRGYGRDAIGILLDYGFRLRNLRKIWLTVNDNNPRAIRAYLACGFREEGRQRGQVWNAGEYVDLVFMGLLREEWQGR